MSFFLRKAHEDLHFTGFLSSKTGWQCVYAIRLTVLRDLKEKGVREKDWCLFRTTGALSRILASVFWQAQIDQQHGEDDLILC